MRAMFPSCIHPQYSPEQDTAVHLTGSLNLTLRSRVVRVNFVAKKDLIIRNSLLVRKVPRVFLPTLFVARGAYEKLHVNSESCMVILVLQWLRQAGAPAREGSWRQNV